MMVHNNRLYPSWIDLLVILGIIFLANIVGGFSALLLPAGKPQGMLLGYSAGMTLAIAGVLLHRKLVGGEKPRCNRFNLRFDHVAVILWGLLLVVAVSVMIDPLTNLMPKENYEQMTGMIGQGGWAVLMTVVAAPLFEETLFRGIIQNSAMRRWGDYGGLLIASVIFAVIHIVPVQIVGAFFVSLAIGYVYLRTRSLLAVMLIHAANNIIAMLQSSLSGGKMIPLSELVGNRRLYLFIYWSCVALCVTSVVFIILKSRPAKPDAGAQPANLPAE
ncbi:MAG: CPBP family intramembrane metalloprotease [Rikenellaceae bacterium]|jgi:membrane protease YdiL (CAAX protease family)|nr:CPBP family intramembrane metalloprotease [Rikenellaceae bacterium]